MNPIPLHSLLTLAIAMWFAQAVLLRAETVQYAYDEAGRLVGASYEDGDTIHYLYDSAGNLLRRSIVAFVDDDGNNIDDGWETQHFGTTGIGPEDDPDADGMTNLQEFFAGTDPNDPADLLRVTELRSPDGGATFTIEWAAVTGKIYRVQYNDTLLPHDWHDLPGDIVAEGPTASKTDVSAAGLPRRFYRAGIIQ